MLPATTSPFAVGDSCLILLAPVFAAIPAFPWWGMFWGFFPTLLDLFACCALWCIWAFVDFPVRVLCELCPGVSWNNFVIVPTAFVRPSLNIIFVPGRINSGFFMNLKRHIARSPVRRCSLSIVSIVAVCLRLPQ